MGLFGIKTKKDREFELQLQQNEQAYQAKLQREANESREREARNRDEQQNRREQQKIAAEQKEAAEKRKSAEEIERIKADAEVKAAEIERQTQLDLAEKENQKFAIRAQAEKEIRTKESEEQTRHIEIGAEKEIELAEKNKQVQMKAIEATQEMFSSYLQFISESKRAEIEFLVHQSESRKAKFLTSIEEAGKRKQYLLDLSKDVKGQEKVNYLNEAHDIEESIKEMQNADKEVDMDLAAKLTMLSDSQKRELAQGQEKLMNVKTLFLNYEGDVQ